MRKSNFEFRFIIIFLLIPVITIAAGGADTSIGEGLAIVGGCLLLFVILPLATLVTTLRFLFAGGEKRKAIAYAATAINVVSSICLLGYSMAPKQDYWGTMQYPHRNAQELLRLLLMIGLVPALCLVILLIKELWSRRGSK